MAPPGRKRRTGARAAGVGYVGLGFLLFFAISSTADGSLFKRKQQVQQQPPGSGGRGGKSRGGKRGKVKEDVAWLLEDNSDGGWKPVRDDGHTQVWKRSMPNSDFVAIKSKASLAVSPQALFEVLTPGDIEIVRQYNPLVEDGSDLEVIDRDNKISWSATTGIWPCRPRDFVTHIQRATLDDGSVAIVNSATTHSKAPAKGKYVRGEILHGVFHIKAAKNKKHSEFTMVHHFNPGGNIPPWLINWLAEGKPAAFVRKLEEVAKKWDEQAALTKSMPCKGRGFADKPCAFLLSPAAGVEGTEGEGNGARKGDRGWATPFITTLTAVALVCCGWMACFGWPGLTVPWAEKEGSPAVAAATVKVEGKAVKEENGTTVAGAAGVRAVPVALETSHPSTLERPPTVDQEVGQQAVARGEPVVKKVTGERSVYGGEAPVLVGELNGEASNGQRLPNGDAKVRGEGVSVEENSCGACAAGEKEELVLSAAGASGDDLQALAARAGTEMPEEENETPIGGSVGADLPKEEGKARARTAEKGVSEEGSGALVGFVEADLPNEVESLARTAENGALEDESHASREESGAPVVDEEPASKELAVGEAAGVERNGGGAKDLKESAARQPHNGNPGAVVEVLSAREVLDDDACNRNEGGGVMQSGGVPSVEVLHDKAAHGFTPLDPLFSFGDQPFESSVG